VNRAKGYQGFTLIELMIVVAIIGLLAAIAIPKFANLVIKAKEASIKGKLGTLRSAVSIYYANNEGVWPYDLNHFSGTITPLVPRYVDEVPSIQIPTVPSHLTGSFTSNTGVIWDADMDDTTFHRVYAYDRLNGKLVINCTHTDSKGTTWSLW